MLVSCKETKNRKQLIALLQEWDRKIVEFPSRSIFTIQGKDTVDLNITHQYKILTYIDSAGCTRCRLRLADWNKFMKQVDSLCTDSVQFLFFFFPKETMELSETLKAELFNYPVCIDDQDSLNLINKFPNRMDFQTFLLDGENKVLAVGNPVYNNVVRNLYLKILTDNVLSADENSKLTFLRINQTVFDMGTFPWRENQIMSLSIQNIGSVPLVINDVITSCGCTKVDYPKEPILPTKSDTLRINYQAERPEYFNKTISIYCNVASSPITVKLKGNAEK